MPASNNVLLASKFVLQQLAIHQAKATKRPLFVGVQGPQGCGKSFLTSLLPAHLKEQHSLSSISLSLDDLYLPHDQLTSLAEKHPNNRMWKGRGQPGTHDITLGLHCLKALSEGRPVKLPTYDKSLHGGQGDRAQATVDVPAGPVDIVFFEGWMTGFASMGSTRLQQTYDEATKDPEGWARQHLDYERPFFIAHDLDSLKLVDDALEDYKEMWSYLDCFIKLKPESMTFVWDWRLQQEHHMMAKNGGVGMTDEQVKAFIERYMPGYELFWCGIHDAGASWAGHGLELVLSRDREIVSNSTF